MKTNQYPARRTMLLTLAAGFAWLLLPMLAHADELGDLQERFKDRFPKLKELRDSKVVGETWDGWVREVQEGTDKAITEIVAAENADRKALYVLLAVRQKTTPELVGERNGLRIFKAAEPDHLLKPKGGTWTPKKDVKIEG